MKFRVLLLTILTFSLMVVPVLGYENSSETFDTSLVNGLEYSYQEPQKLAFVQLKGNYDTLSLSTKSFLDVLYYFSITKLKLKSLPFHYAIDENGDVFQTQEYDATVVTDVGGITVAYLSNNPQISTKARSAMLELANDLSEKYGITPYGAYGYTIEESDSSLSQIKLVESNDIFEGAVNSVLESWSKSEREHLEYSAEIVSVEYGETIEIGDRLPVKVSVRNNNDFVWFSDKYPIYISVKDSAESIYAVNGEWDSFSKPTHIDADDYVLPSQTIDLTFNIDPKVLPGEVSETFNLLKFDGEVFANSEFTVNFTVEKGDNKLVRITSPEYGFVNIRSCRWYSCEKVEVANDGDVYIVLKEEEGWYEILFGQDKEGWVYSKYAKEI